MILAEELGKDRGAVPHLVALAESLGAPVIDAWRPFYVNFPRKHPLYSGVVAAEMAEVIEDADFVLSLSASARGIRRPRCRAQA